MKVAVLIPDRNDRPEFLANCLRMMQAQTLQPAHIELVNDAPLNSACDITYRYRIGYDRLRGKGFDVIALIENDDYYAPEYLETMVTKWQAYGKPDIFGTNYTIYYHLRLKARYGMEHYQRASAMNTLIKPDLEFPWCLDHEAYTDMHLWMKAGLKGITFRPDKIISVGMKHGTGMCGGSFHNDKLHRYNPRELSHMAEFLQPREDKELNWLRTHLDRESFNFYSEMIRHFNESHAAVIM